MRMSVCGTTGPFDIEFEIPWNLSHMRNTACEQRKKGVAPLRGRAKTRRGRGGVRVMAEAASETAAVLHCPNLNFFTSLV